jgi:membrane-associated PAP2 superfamily phosphatase
MDRVGMALVLAIAGVVAWLFTLVPQLDLAIAGIFFDSARGDFALRLVPWLGWLRGAVPWTVAALVAPAVIALVVKLAHPAARMLVPGRAILFLLATLLVGPGLLVNVTLKDHWGRPRPIEVTRFGGTQPFVPWWNPRGPCAKNCSFVAGESAGAFWTLAPAALAPPQWRALAYGAAFGFGAATGLLRMAFGGHFFTDVVFAGVLMFVVVWITHGLIYRWRATRLSDRDVERRIERTALVAHDGAREVIDRISTAARRFLRPPGDR